MRQFESFKILLLATFLFFSGFSLSSAELSGIDVNIEVSGCNFDYICEDGVENLQSCPSDCTPPDLSGNIPMLESNLFQGLIVETSYHSAVIKWRSTVPTMNNIKWGTNPDYRDGSIKNINYLLDHKFELTGLRDGTIYYFTIQAENYLGGTKESGNRYFQTLSLADLVPPANVTNVKAVSKTGGITISWKNPSDADFEYVRVLRSIDRFHSNPKVGHLAYEGSGGYFTDGNVSVGIKYFYSLFSVDEKGNYSSGSLISITHNPDTVNVVTPHYPPFVEEQIFSEIYIITQKYLNYNFEMGSVISLSGDSLITIKTNYTPKNKNEDMWVEIRSLNNEEVIARYFFTSIKDQDGFLIAQIPSFARGGSYSINIIRYVDGTPKLINQGVLNITKEIDGKTTISPFSPYFVILLIIFIICLFIWLYFVILHEFVKRHTQN
jgi:hypothetical protein